MSVYGHWLTLLVPFLSLCGATEYYVRPTEPTNTSCPAQPCLTLSQYINDSDHYFQSNTVFKFLPGIHPMNTPAILHGLHNISWTRSESGSNKIPAYLVAKFSHEEVQACMIAVLQGYQYLPSCSAIQLYSLHNVMLEKISLTVTTPGISAVNGQYVSNVYINLNTTCSASSCKISPGGIFLHEAKSVKVYTSHINRFSYGLVLSTTINTTITDTTVVDSSFDGIYLSNATDTTIINATVKRNSNGIHLVKTTKTSIINPTLLHNKYSGVHLNMDHTTTITNITAMYSFFGAYFRSSNNTTIINARIVHNQSGLDIRTTTNICIINPHISYCKYDGVYLAGTTDTCIVNASIHMCPRGMGVSNAINTIFINTTILQSVRSGLVFIHGTNITMINPTVLDSGDTGIDMLYTINTSITNPILLNNKGHGLRMLLTTITTLFNLSIFHNGEYGVLMESTGDTTIINATVMFNGWNFRAPSLNGDFMLQSCSHTTICNSSFTNLSTAASAASTADLTSLPAIIVLYHSSLHISGCDFAGNKVTAIKAFASNITVSGDLVFSSNRAIAGSAFILIEDSVLNLTDNSYLYFENNYATEFGGVFYVAGNAHYEVLNEAHNDADYVHSLKTVMLQSKCFLNTEGSGFKSRLTFVNNSAGNGGDILYGGNVLYGLDGDLNCLLSFKNISNISQNGLSLITSDPSRVCLCNASGQPDCLIVADPTPHSIYPGQSISISAVVVGQDFGTVAGSVYAQFIQKSAAEFWQMSDMQQKLQTVTQKVCNDLTYVIFSPENVSETVLVLTASSMNVTQFFTYERETSVEWSTVHKTTALEPLEYIHFPLYINITFLPCPAGFMLTTDPPFKCDCNMLLQTLQGVKCYVQDQFICRNGLIWVGTLKADNGTVVGSDNCMFDYCNKGDVNVTLNDPDSQCNYNHSGTLCGGCQPSLSLALGSAQCLPCSNKYLALLIPFALAGPSLVFLLKLLDLTVSQGTVNGLILYANIVKANEYISLPQGQTNPLTLFIAWLNLDLGVETCFFHGMTAYTKTWLQFVFPLYIWSIAGLIIILAKYSERVAKVMGNNSVPVLATLFLLSYAKLLRTIIAALSYTMLYSTQGHKAVWSADGNVDYLGPKHAPLFAVAVAALLFLLLPYTLLLFLGQWLQRCNCRLMGSTLIKTFLNAHYDSLKSKHCYWLGVLLLVRAAILLISALIPVNHGDKINACIAVSAVLLNYFGLIVYRSTAVALYDISFFMNLALLGVASFFTITVGGDRTVAAYALIGIAFVQFLGLIIFKLFSILKRTERVKACLHKGQPDEDDWELYEEAALRREMESDTEDEESDGSSSVESLPTY